MQISRHWRMNANRYRLVGVRYEDGQVSAYDRPAPAPQVSDSSISSANLSENHMPALTAESAA